MAQGCEEDDWRDCMEFLETKCKIKEHEFTVLQMEELPIAASLFMLADLREEDQEISGTRLWAGSHVLAHVGKGFSSWFGF